MASLRNCIGGTALLVGLYAAPASVHADPVPASQCPLPFVSALRITQFEPTGLANSYRIMFEVINFTNQEVHGFTFIENAATGAGVVINNFTSEIDGRPFGTGNDDNLNFPSADGTADPALSRPLHDWAISFFPGTITSSWAGVLQVAPSPAIVPLDIASACLANPANRLAAAQHACSLFDFQPGAGGGCVAPITDYANRLENRESVDNGPNVLDGFSFEVRNWPVKTVLSFNWQLYDGDQNPIRHPYAFGVFNLCLGGCPLKAFKESGGFSVADIFRPAPPPAPAARLAAASATPLDLLTVEIGPGQTAALRNSGDRARVVQALGLSPAEEQQLFTVNVTLNDQTAGASPVPLLAVRGWESGGALAFALALLSVAWLMVTRRRRLGSGQ